jgi:hypothetical protein
MDVQEIITEQTFDPQQLATLNREELVNTLKEIVENGEITAIKEQVDCIKQLFYKRQQQERAEAMNSVAEEVENEEVAAEPKQKQADPVEAEFKAVMGIYRDKKAAYIAAIEAEQAANLDKKRAILEKLKALVGNEGEIKDTIAAFRQLQSEWREIGPVAPTYVNDIWREYNLYQEQIYDLIKIDAELREYAFKKNLEDKTRLIEQAEKLNDELWIDDNVTGNGSGSYYCNSWKAEEAIAHNLDLLGEALQEFGSGPEYLIEQGAEAADVTIRCYLLNGAISKALDELEEEAEENGEQ